MLWYVKKNQQERRTLPSLDPTEICFLNLGAAQMEPCKAACFLQKSAQCFPEWLQQHPLSVIVLILVIITGVRRKKYLTIILICISMVSEDTGHFKGIS